MAFTHELLWAAGPGHAADLDPALPARGGGRGPRGRLPTRGPAGTSTGWPSTTVLPATWSRSAGYEARASEQALLLGAYGDAEHHADLGLRDLADLAQAGGSQPRRTSS